MDCEGTPVQEVSAIEMSYETKEILDVFHAYAKCDYYKDDIWCRNHLHGLNPDFLERHGVKSEAVLRQDLRHWLAKKNYFYIYVNAAQKESNFLFHDMIDIELPSWIDRVKLVSHKVAFRFKQLNAAVLRTVCPEEAHSSYKSHCPQIRTQTQKLKAFHGYHCSLYDAYELYLYHVMDE